MGLALSDADIRRFKADGYIAPVRVATENAANDWRHQLEAYEAEHGGPLKGSVRFKSHLLFKWLADLVRSPAVLDPVEDLIGPDILCWTTHWFVKEARSPQYVSWHQDSNYWGLDTEDLVSVWLAVSPATVQSGCLRLLPESHRVPAMAHVDTYDQDNMLTRGQTIMDVDESRAVNLELAPGQVALFDYRLAHASYPNRSDDRRIGIGLRYIPPSARQTMSDWDSATLVRGEDRHGHFELEPTPSCDFDPPAVAIQQRSDEAQRKVYYAATGAA